MIEKDKSLTEKKENIFKRLFSFIKSLFNKDHLKSLPENDAKIEESSEELLETSRFDYEEEQTPHLDKEEAEEKYKKIKEKFFERYNQFKKDEIKVTDLTDRELLMTEELLDEEVEYLREESNKQEYRNYTLTEKIAALEKQIKLNNEEQQ